MDKKRNGTAVWEVGINNQLSAVSYQLSAISYQLRHNDHHTLPQNTMRQNSLQRFKQRGS